MYTSMFCQWRRLVVTCINYAVTSSGHKNFHNSTFNFFNFEPNTCYFFLLIIININCGACINNLLYEVVVRKLCIYFFGKSIIK